MAGPFETLKAFQKIKHMGLATSVMEVGEWKAFCPLGALTSFFLSGKWICFVRQHGPRDAAQCICWLHGPQYQKADLISDHLIMFLKIVCADPLCLF